MNFKFLGGILMIVGTSIGGGMLALPVSNGTIGFMNSNLFLLICWVIMTLGALLILEINLWLPKDTNLVSMAAKTLGFPGKVIAWSLSLLLLYTLLCAYISGSSDILQGILQTIGLEISQSLSAIIFVISFGIIVYLGIQSVDRVNRALMFGKLLVYLCLVFLISPYMNIKNLNTSHINAVSGSLFMVLLVSFGFANIVPSLRAYFNDDIQQLRKVIIVGSFIPLVCYIIWDSVIMGVIPRNGAYGLLHLFHSANPNSSLTQSLMVMTKNHHITEFFRYFSSICMLTSFLCVSLSLFDFLADGLKIPKKGWSKLSIAFLTFMPPLAVVLFDPSIFIKSLTYAGVCCIVLLLIFPTIMAWRGRYILKIANADSYQVIGGKLGLSGFGIVSMIFLLIEIRKFL